MAESFVKLCTCRACNSVYIDTDPGEDSKSYPTEAVKKFKLQPLVDNDCPSCPKGESEVVTNLDYNMNRSREVQRQVTKYNSKAYVNAL